MLVTGMGGDVGTRISNLLEADGPRRCGAGCRHRPARLRLHGADFVRVDPRDRRRLVRTIREFEPTAVVHFGDATGRTRRVGPTFAHVLHRTACTVTALGPGVEYALARTGGRAIGHRGVRTGTWQRRAARRVGRDGTDLAVRPFARRGRDAGPRHDRSGVGAGRVSCGAPRSSARISPVPSGGCCGYLSCPSPRCQTSRSRSCTTTTPRTPSSDRAVARR